MTEHPEPAPDPAGGLYSPGIVCFFAILICFYTSSGMCCSAACCGCVKKDGTASGCCGCAKKDGKEQLGRASHRKLSPDP